MPLTHAFRFEGETLIWTFNDVEYAWRRLSIDQYPEWLDAQVSAANVRMDEMEKIG